MSCAAAALEASKEGAKGSGCTYDNWRECGSGAVQHLRMARREAGGALEPHAKEGRLAGSADPRRRVIATRLPGQCHALVHEVEAVHARVEPGLLERHVAVAGV